MAPWPGIRRGTEPSVPTVPGLVSVIVVPSKSSMVSLFARARVTMSSNASTYWAKFSAPASLILGTLSERDAILAFDIHRDADIDAVAHRSKRLAVGLGVGVVQARIGSNRFHDGPADNVRVGNLALADQRTVIVQDPAVLVDHLYRDHAL